MLLVIVGVADVVLRDVLIRCRRRWRFARGISVQNVVVYVIVVVVVVKQYLRRQRQRGTGRHRAAAQPSVGAVHVPMAAAAGRYRLVLIEIRMVVLVFLLVIVGRFGRLVRGERWRRSGHVVVTAVRVVCGRGWLLQRVIVLMLLLLLVVLLHVLLLLLLLLQVQSVMVLELGVLHQELYRFNTRQYRGNDIIL